MRLMDVSFGQSLENKRNSTTVESSLLTAAVAEYPMRIFPHNKITRKGLNLFKIKCNYLFDIGVQTEGYRTV